MIEMVHMVMLVVSVRLACAQRHLVHLHRRQLEVQPDIGQPGNGWTTGEQRTVGFDFVIDQLREGEGAD